MGENSDSDVKPDKTHNRAESLPDGSVASPHRASDQVTSRGLRVELDELETVLSQHPAVRECVVLSRPHGAEAGGGAEGAPDRLVAYVVFEQTPSSDASDLRRFLRETVPHHLVPGAFVTLDRLPVNSAGNVDRHALPEPGHTQFERSSAFVEPAEEAHWRLRDLWASELNIPSSTISLDDRFLELGGHSSTAESLLTRINQVFAMNLTSTTLSEAPTILELAVVIKDQGWKPETSSIIPIQPNGSKPPLFFIGRSLAICHRLASLLGDDQPIYVVRRERFTLRRLSGDRLPYPQVREFARQFVRDIEEIRPQGPCTVAGHSFDGVLAMEIAHLLADNDHPVPLVALLDSWRPGYRVEGENRDAAGRAGATAPPRIPRLRRRLGRRLKRLYFSLSGRWYLPAKYTLSQWLGRPLPRSLQNPAWVRRDAVLRGIGYDYRPYHGRVTLFRAMDGRHKADEDDYGWGRVVPGGVEVVKIPGDHLSMMREPKVQVLISSLAQRLSAIAGPDESVDKS